MFWFERFAPGKPEESRNYRSHYYKKPQGDDRNHQDSHTVSCAPSEETKVVTIDRLRTGSCDGRHGSM